MWQTPNDSWSRPHLTTARYISHYATSCANPSILHNTHNTIPTIVFIFIFFLILTRLASFQNVTNPGRSY